MLIMTSLIVERLTMLGSFRPLLIACYDIAVHARTYISMLEDKKYCVVLVFAVETIEDAGKQIVP